MDVELIGRLSAIYTIATNTTTPKDLFRIINAVTPRNWCFSITFDLHNRNKIAIKCDPPLTKFELLNILSGKIPSLFLSDEVCFEIDCNSYHIDLSNLLLNSPQITKIKPLKFVNSEVIGQIIFCGYPPNPIFQNIKMIEEWLVRKTWIGSKKYNKKNFNINLNLLANIECVKPVRISCGEYKENTFEKQKSIFIDGSFHGDFYLLCDNRDKNQFRHEMFGKFDPEIVLPTFWKQVENVLGSKCCIELSSHGIEWFSLKGPDNVIQFRRILYSILSSLENISEDSAYKKYKKRSDKEKIIVTAKRMKNRQGLLQCRPMVIVGENNIFCQPTCENETVALFMKLEGMNMLPFECNVIEYTSQIDIDALANYRINPTETFEMFAPVEFEYRLENFFLHKHPPQQVKLIISWTIGENLFDDDCLEETDKKWLYKIQLEGYTIPCAIIELFPNIKISESKNVS